MSASRWVAAEALPGRDSPNASEAPTGRIEAGDILTEIERRGMWFHVATPLGKHLWVDGRRLQEVEAVEAPVDPPPEEEVAPTEPEPEPVSPPVQAAAPTWTATHAVPPEGLPAWAEPDPGGPVIANLAGRVELRVVERRADWAHVDAENGWQGWVDGRRLVATGAVTPQAPQPIPPTTTEEAEPAPTRSISLRSVAAFAVPISGFLPWFGSWLGDASSSAADVPAAFLWSPYAELRFPNMGTVMLVVGAAVLATEYVRKYAQYRRIAAGVTIGVVALYLVQMFRLFLDWEGEFATAVSSMVTEGLAIGPLLALAAGIVLLVTQPPEDTVA